MQPEAKQGHSCRRFRESPGRAPFRRAGRAGVRTRPFEAGIATGGRVVRDRARLAGIPIPRGAFRQPPWGAVETRSRGFQTDGPFSVHCSSWHRISKAKLRSPFDFFDCTQYCTQKRNRTPHSKNPLQELVVFSRARQGQDNRLFAARTLSLHCRPHSRHRTPASFLTASGAGPRGTRSSARGACRRVLDRQVGDGEDGEADRVRRTGRQEEAWDHDGNDGLHRGHAEG